MDIDLKLIGVNHNIWCMKLNQYVNSDSAIPPAMSHRECELGKWLYSTGLSTYGSLSDLMKLEKTHQQFHELSQKIMKFKQQGDVNGARKLLFELEDKSDEVINLIRSVDKQVNK